MGRSLRVQHNELPPTENHIRVHRWGGGEAYSKEAEGYRQGFLTRVGKLYMREIQQFLAGHTTFAVYRTQIVLLFPTEKVVNVNFGARKKPAKTPYKKMDTGNRRKLLEDCLIGSFGGPISPIDDSIFFDLRMMKCAVSTPEEVGVDILVEEVDPKQFGIDLESTWANIRSTRST